MLQFPVGKGCKVKWWKYSCKCSIHLDWHMLCCCPLYLLNATHFGWVPHATPLQITPTIPLRKAHPPFLSLSESLGEKPSLLVYSKLMWEAQWCKWFILWVIYCVKMSAINFRPLPLTAAHDSDIKDGALLCTEGYWPLRHIKRRPAGGVCIY